MSGLVYLRGVTTLELDQSLCTGCGICATVCPHAVFTVDELAVIRDRDACMECGACAKNCRFDAIKVRTGVGCATAIINAAIRGGEPNCDCAKERSCC